MQLINQIEHKIFDNVSFAGPSWVPETASVNKGHLIMDNVTTISGQSSVGAAGDGSIELVTAFCEAAITGNRLLTWWKKLTIPLFWVCWACRRLMKDG